jgi:hypothetical protein
VKIKTGDVGLTVTGAVGLDGKKHLLFQSDDLID